MDVAGQILHENSPALRKTLFRHSRGTQRLAMNLDLGVDSIDSFPVLLLWWKSSKRDASPGSGDLLRSDWSCLEVLELTHLKGVFEIRETEAQALEA